MFNVYTNICSIPLHRGLLIFFGNIIVWIKLNVKGHRFNISWDFVGGKYKYTRKKYIGEQVENHTVYI
jgi:hypothetical protein